jgi:hypothetical protein
MFEIVLLSSHFAIKLIIRQFQHFVLVYQQHQQHQQQAAPTNATNRSSNASRREIYFAELVEQTSIDRSRLMSLLRKRSIIRAFPLDMTRAFAIDRVSSSSNFDQLI